MTDTLQGDIMMDTMSCVVCGTPFSDEFREQATKGGYQNGEGRYKNGELSIWCSKCAGWRSVRTCSVIIYAEEPV